MAVFASKRSNIKAKLGFQKSDDTNSYKHIGNGYEYKKWYGKTKHRKVFEIGYTLKELAALTGVWKVDNINVIEELRASAYNSDLYADVIMALVDCICVPNPPKYINALLSVCQKYIEAEKGFHLRTKSTYQYLWVKAVYSAAVKELRGIEAEPERRLEEEQAPIAKQDTFSTQASDQAEKETRRIETEEHKRKEQEERQLTLTVYYQHYKAIVDEYALFKQYKGKHETLSTLFKLKEHAKTISDLAAKASLTARDFNAGWHGNYNKHHAIDAASAVDRTFLKVKHLNMDDFTESFWNNLDSVINNFKNVVTAWCKELIDEDERSGQQATAAVPSS